MGTPIENFPSSGLCECECDGSWLRKEVALRVEQRAKPTMRASACMISGSNASTESTPTSTTGNLKAKNQPVAGIHVTRHIVGQAMAVPPNATIDAHSPPSSNAANKTPTSSRKYISRLPSSFSYFSLSLSSSVCRSVGTIDLLSSDRLPTVSASDAFRNLSDDDHQSPSNAYTDISELDHALGGGFECGRVTELWGPPGAGKTAIAYVNALAKSHVFGLTSSQPESRCVCPTKRCSRCLDR
jgi:hypothetical protein